MDPMEILWNEQRADVAFFRIMLTTFLVRVIAANPATAEERLQDLQNGVMDVVNRMQASPADQGENRMKALVSMRAEHFFLDLREVISQTRSKTGEAGRN